MPMNRTLVLVAMAALFMLPASIGRATPELPAAQKSDDDEELAHFRVAIAEIRAVMLRPEIGSKAGTSVVPIWMRKSARAGRTATIP